MKKMFHLHLSNFRCFKKNRIVSLRVMLLVLLNLITIHVWSQSERIYVFSVSKTRRVIFSPGNLQYDRSTKKWSFASKQYEIYGTNNVTGGEAKETDPNSGYENKTSTGLANKIDLFGWSAKGNKAPFGVSTSVTDSHYSGAFVDWGTNKIGDYPAGTWRTLTYAEWRYLRRERPNADKLLGVAQLEIAGVKGTNKDGGFVNGLIILPDNWVCPEDITFKTGFSTKGTGMQYYDDHQTFTKAQWEKLEAAGAVFLPAAGFRQDTRMFNVQRSTGYWSSSNNGSTNEAGHLSINAKGAGLDSTNVRWGGRAVRLVKNFTPILVNDVPKITSSKGDTITKYVSITILNYVDKATITGESSNSAFTVGKLSNKAPGTYNLVISYAPTATSDGTETATITLKSSAGGETTTFTITGRHLPAEFAVISKMGNQWYALSSEPMAKGSPAVLVSVNDNTNPTEVTMGPENIGWSLEQPTKGTRRDRILLTNSDGYCLRGRSDSISLRTDTLNKSSWAEWHPKTADLIKYNLTNLSLEKRLSLSRQKTFGTFDDYVSDVVRFVTIKTSNTYEQADLRVVEWYPTKVLLYSNESQYVKSATVYIDDAKQTSAEVAIVGHNLLEITGLDFVDTITINAGKRLSVRYTKDGKTYGQTITIPIILSGSLSLLKGYKNYTTGSAHLNKHTNTTRQYLDVIVRDKATLAINSSVLSKNTFSNVYIYPSGRIVVNDSLTFRINSLTFCGGIDEIYDGSTYSEYKYEVPKLVLKDGVNGGGRLQKTKAAIDYIMRVDLKQMYSLALPYDVAFADITYWDGEAMTPGTQLYVSTYDGQARANLDMKNTWLYETEFPSQKLTAGVGYTISAEPQADANSTLPMDSYALIRMPMKNNLTAEGKEQDKTVAVTAYANQNGVTISDNHKGWNLVGNPFLTDISSDMNGDQIVLGYLKETGTGPWEWVNDAVRYVTIPSDDGTYYWQEQFKNTTLKPFKNFFVQIANTGEPSFALSCRKNAPARYLLNDMEQETELEILLSGDNQSDHTGFLVSEQYSPAYEINADLEKMVGAMSLYSIYGGYSLAYNALSWTDAEQQISLGYRLPVSGEYTLSIRENALIDSVQHVYLTDHVANVVVDLLDGEYQFISQVKENEDRFTIQLIRKDETDNTITNIDDTEKYNKCTQKLYYQGQLFIMHKGKIYNTLGQKITKQ